MLGGGGEEVGLRDAAASTRNARYRSEADMASSRACTLAWPVRVMESALWRGSVIMYFLIVEGSRMDPCQRPRASVEYGINIPGARHALHRDLFGKLGNILMVNVDWNGAFEAFLRHAVVENRRTVSTGSQRRRLFAKRFVHECAELDTR